MRLIKTFPILFFLIIGSATMAQKPMADNINKFHRSGNEITFSTGTDAVKLKFYTPKVFRMQTNKTGEFGNDEGWMLVPQDEKPVSLRIDSSSKQITIATSDVKINLNRSPFHLDVFDSEGKLLSSENSSLTGKNGNSQRGDTVVCSKVLQPDEHFFGFGEKMDFLDQRGKRTVLNVGRGETKGFGNLLGAYNTIEANYSPIPFFMSTRGYGIFFHTRFQSIWDMAYLRPDAYSFEAVDGEMDYFFIFGPDFPNLINEYTTLTGKSPLLPKYAMGLHMGTYSGGTWGHEQHASPAYVLALIRKFRELGIPIDVLFLDSTWRLFEEGGHGATTFEWRKSFVDPRHMFDSLYAMHLNAVGLHIRPRLDNGPKYHLLDKAQQAGITYPEDGKPGEFPNFFDKKAVSWWWNNAAMKVASQGAKFFKTDEGSAFGRMANESSKMGPQDSAALSLHNIFPLAYTSAAFDNFQQYNGRRGMNQTREGYAGIQRYPYIFAGDWPSQWQFFEPVIKAGLNIGMSGVGYWTHCMGGFEQPADPELYIRWVQFGMFSPIAMAFGMDHPGYKEPWNYGEEGLQNFKKYDSIRYSLIPYIYSSAYQLYNTGMPIMRALPLLYQGDYNVYNITDQYMFGDYMMICPVTVKGAGSRLVYLPEGTWYDYWTGRKYEGKKYVTVLCPLMEMPIFIKAGAIIPSQPEMQYVGQKPVDTITWSIYPEGNSSYSLYDDDGQSMNYQKGDFATTRITSNEKDNRIQIFIGKTEGHYKVNNRSYILKIRSDKRPSSVREGNQILAASLINDGSGWYFNEDEKCLWVYTKGDNTRDIHISIAK